MNPADPTLRVVGPMLLHLIRFGGRITSLREVSGPPLREHGVLAHHRPVRLRRAKLLERVFDLDLDHCPNCSPCCAVFKVPWGREMSV